MGAQQQILSLGITFISRTLMVRDRMLKRVANPLPMDASISLSRYAIPSGHNRIDAVFVTPAPEQVKANLLICHGIGETVEHWFIVQQLLASCGVASLIFNYSGYARSSGSFSPRQAEQDTESAFEFLGEIATPAPTSLLGFSLGSGIAAAAAPKLPIHRLVLGAAFTSLRKGAISIALPRSLRFLIPEIWDSESAMRSCAVPVLIVHGDRDRLFPVRMAEQLKSACTAPCELIIVPGLAHNEPFFRPHLSYWKMIADRLV